MTEDIPSIIIALIFIFLAIRYFYPNTPSNSSISTASTVGIDGAPTSGPLRGITSDQVELLTNTFPDIPPMAIVYSLSKTKNEDTTAHEIMDKGFLVEPPASFPVHPYLLRLRERQAAADAISPSIPSSSPAMTAARRYLSSPSLITKYNLSNEIKHHQQPPSRNMAGNQEHHDVYDNHHDNGVKGLQTDTVNYKMMTLEEKKRKLILDSRIRLMAKLKGQTRIDGGN